MRRFYTAALVAIAWAVIFAFAIVNQQSITTIDSEWGCCTITINKTLNVVGFTNRFEGNYSETELTFSSEDEMQHALDIFEDICYYEHN